MWLFKQTYLLLGRSIYCSTQDDSFYIYWTTSLLIGGSWYPNTDLMHPYPELLQCLSEGSHLTSGQMSMPQLLP
jgi:hypothetical protein